MNNFKEVTVKITFSSTEEKRGVQEGESSLTFPPPPPDRTSTGARSPGFSEAPPPPGHPEDSGQEETATGGLPPPPDISLAGSGSGLTNWTGIDPPPPPITGKDAEGVGSKEDIAPPDLDERKKAGRKSKGDSSSAKN